MLDKGIDRVGNAVSLVVRQSEEPLLDCGMQVDVPGHAYHEITRERYLLCMLLVSSARVEPTPASTAPAYPFPLNPPLLPPCPVPVQG